MASAFGAPKRRPAPAASTIPTTARSVRRPSRLSTCTSAASRDASRRAYSPSERWIAITATSSPSSRSSHAQASPLANRTLLISDQARSRVSSTLRTTMPLLRRDRRAIRANRHMATATSQPKPHSSNESATDQPS